RDARRDAGAGDRANRGVPARRRAVDHRRDARAFRHGVAPSLHRAGDARICLTIRRGPASRADDRVEKTTMHDERRHAPAADRTREPIGAVLRRVLPPSGTVLEIASGTGQHAAFFAALFPALVWQPSERDPDALPSIRAWAAHTGAANLRPPLV